MRHSLLASALEVAGENSRFQEQIALFEVGLVYLAGEEGTCRMRNHGWPWCSAVGAHSPSGGTVRQARWTSST